MTVKYTSSSSKGLQETVAEHDRLLTIQNNELKKQKDITFFFTIIVGATLVATLVGLGGIYVLEWGKSGNEIKSIGTKVDELSKEVNQLNSNFLILRAKNSHLK